MADITEIITTHKDQLAGLDTESFGKLSAKLAELGYDTLINEKKKEEFVPSARLHEVVAQRNAAKAQTDQLSQQLETMKKSAAGNEELQKQIQALIDQNKQMDSQMEELRVNSEIKVVALQSGAKSPEDILLFVDKSALKVNKTGQILGLEAEMARLKKDKPYLFNDGQTQPNKGGSPGGSGTQPPSSINAAIRAAAYR